MEHSFLYLLIFFSSHHFFMTILWQFYSYESHQTSSCILLSITFSSQNWHKILFSHIVVKMWWKSEYQKNIWITNSSHFCHNLMNLKSLWINVMMNIPTKLELLLPHPIVIKMWWKCDEQYLVLIFWLLPLKISSLQK